MARSKKKFEVPKLLDHVTHAQLEKIALREAEKDKELSTYYVGRDRYLDRALDMDDPASIFIGPKGVGKSAILEMVRVEKRSDANRVIDIQPDDLAFHSLANIAATTPLLEEEGKNQALFKSLWDYVLITEIAKREYKTTNGLLQALSKFFTASADQRSLQRILKKTFDDEGVATTFTQRMLTLVKEVELEAGAEGMSAKASFAGGATTSNHLETVPKRLI